MFVIRVSKKTTNIKTERKIDMLTAKIGRNDPCSCGSGKKYKKCCMNLEKPSSSDLASVDFKWHQLRQLENTVVNQHVKPYALKQMPDEVMKSAFVDCFPDELPEDLDEELLYDNYFLPWYLFSWTPNDTFGLEQFDSQMTLAQNYMKMYRNRLNSQEKNFIEAISQSYYSFYSILAVELEKSLTVKDILLGTTHTLKERAGTRQLKPGDIVFSRILTLDDQSIFVGMAPFKISARYQNQLLDLRDWLRKKSKSKVLTPEMLRFYLADSIRKHYFDILKSAFDNPFPIIQNTDGERFQFTKSYFKLDISPEDAFNHLRPLTFKEDPEEYLREAKKDKSGAIKQIQFPWIKEGNKIHKEWDNTILGHITLEKDRLILEINSQERSQKGRKLLSKYLGDAIMFQQSLIETPEQKMKNAPDLKSTKNKKEDLTEIPEVQEQLKAMAEKHWKNWFDQPIPNLKDKTPREAAKTKEGRERLEALLLYYKHNDSERGDNPFKADIPYLKKELGLEE